MSATTYRITRRFPAENSSGASTPDAVGLASKPKELQVSDTIDSHISAAVRGAVASKIVEELDPHLRDRLLTDAVARVVGSIEVQQLATKLIYARVEQLLETQVAAGAFDAVLADTITEAFARATVAIRDGLTQGLVAAVCGKTDGYDRGPGVVLPYVMAALKQSK